MKYLYGIAFVCFVLLLALQFLVGPLQLWAVIVVTASGGWLAYKIFPRQLRDEMDGIGDFVRAVLALSFILLVMITWQTSQPELLRQIADRGSHVLFQSTLE